MKVARNFAACVSATTLLVACNAILGVGDGYHLGSKASDQDAGSGGVVGAGGANGSGGQVASGGRVGSGGQVTSGGSTNAGGVQDSGGGDPDAGALDCVPMTAECRSPDGGMPFVSTCQSNGTWSDGLPCTSGLCSGGKCLAASCGDGAKDGDETDEDCGGSCAPCPDGNHCGKPADCTSAVCTATTCVAPKCDDGTKNGSESDEDCGGACIAKCAVDQTCRGDSDCSSQICASGHCGVCRPLATQCASGGLETCTAAGKWGTAVACAAPRPQCIGGACVAPTTLTIGGETAIPVGGTPLCVALGDLDDDTISDLVVATDNVSSGIKWFISEGSGFGSPTNFVTAAAPACVAAAEMDQDNHTDVVAAFNTAANNVEVLIGNGTGAVTASTPVSAGYVPSSIIVADLTKDQKQDVVVLSRASNTVVVLLNAGNGTLVSTPALTLSSAYAVTAGDFDGDNWVDIAVARSDAAGQVGIFHNQHNGTFMGPSYYPAGTNPRYVVAADANDDGKMDLFVANESPGEVSYLRNTGTGFATPVPFPVGQVRGLAVGDLNSDGFIDIVSTDFGGDGLRILLNTGTGTFSVLPKIDAPGGPTKVTVGDVTGDTKPDLVVALETSKSVGVFANNTP